jgi:hypothetical protein
LRHRLRPGTARAGVKSNHWQLAACGLTIVVAALAAGSSFANAEHVSDSASSHPTASLTVPSSGPTAAATGPGISIREATHRNQDGPVLVNGYVLLVKGHKARLCTALSAKRPPRCVGPSLTIAGLGPTQRAAVATTKARNVRWSPEPLQILGQVEHGVLRALTTGRA